MRIGPYLDRVVTVGDPLPAQPRQRTVPENLVLLNGLGVIRSATVLVARSCRVLSLGLYVA